MISNGKRANPDGNWTPLTRETTDATGDLIASLLGMTREIARASWFLAQADAPAFLTAKPTDRKRMFGLLLDPAGKWAADKEHAAAKRTAAAAEIAAATAQLADREAMVAQIPALREREAILTGQEQAAAETLAAAEAALERAREAQAHNLAAEERIATLKARFEAATWERDRVMLEHSRAQTAAVALEDAREELAVVTRTAALLPELEKRDLLRREGAVAVRAAKDQRALLEQRAEAYRRDADTLRPEIAELERRNSEARARLTTLARAEDDAERCDRCLQMLGVDAKVAAMASLRDELDRTEQERNEKNDRLTTAWLAHVRATEDAGAIIVADIPDDVSEQLARARAASEQRAALAERVKQLEQTAAALPDIEATVARASAALGTTEHDLAQARQGAQDAAELRRAADVATLDVDHKRKQRETAGHDLIVVRRDIEKLQETEREAGALRLTIQKRQTDLDLYRLAERAFGRDGIPVLLVESVLPQFEADTNAVLRAFPTADGGVFSIRFETQREQATVDTLKEELYAIVQAPDGFEQDFEALSGGEESRVAFAVRVALSELLLRMRGSRAGLIVVDELPWLDISGEEGLVALIRSAIDSGRFSHAIAVSHSERFLGSFEQVVRVEKVNGVSRVVAAPVLEAVPA